MATIDWELAWKKALENKELFPIKAVNDKTLTISCPTRFSNTGELAIEIKPSFNDESIVLELLVFNDNLSLKDLPKSDDKDKSSSEDKFNKMVSRLVDYELSNRIMERFKIKSTGFESDDEAAKALVDYINNKATESGRMFDDKLDELNDIADNSKSEENYDRALNSIRESRAFILKKIESILTNHYGWKSSKNEEYSDTSMQCLDNDGNLMAVITLADRDNCVIVDLAKGISAKVGLMQSDEEIEAELTSDVDNAQEILADREIDQLKDVVAKHDAEVEDDYMESLSRRVSKLESLYIRRKLHGNH